MVVFWFRFRDNLELFSQNLVVQISHSVAQEGFSIVHAPQCFISASVSGGIIKSFYCDYDYYCISMKPGSAEMALEVPAVSTSPAG